MRKIFHALITTPLNESKTTPAIFAEFVKHAAAKLSESVIFSAEAARTAGTAISRIKSRYFLMRYDKLLSVL